MPHAPLVNCEGTRSQNLGVRGQATVLIGPVYYVRGWSVGSRERVQKVQPLARGVSGRIGVSRCGERFQARFSSGARQAPPLPMHSAAWGCSRPPNFEMSLRSFHEWPHAPAPCALKRSPACERPVRGAARSLQVQKARGRAYASRRTDGAACVRGRHSYSKSDEGGHRDGAATILFHDRRIDVHLLKLLCKLLVGRALTE
eukprot:3444315-Prymnesium_polylepis.1